MGFFSSLFRSNSSGKIVSGTADRYGTYSPDAYNQDTTKSVVDENGRYDLKRFSKQECDIIKSVLSSVEKKYPREFRAMGLANEAYPIVYKARYVLFDIIIVKYENSPNALDKLAVALAYESKGAYFRKEAISYFEASIKEIDKATLNKFLSYIPMSLYMKFSELYEKEHDYKKAISYAKKAMSSRGASKEFCMERISSLEKKLEKPTRTTKRKKPDYYQSFEGDIRRAAIAFVTGDFSGIELNARPNKR